MSIKCKSLSDNGEELKNTVIELRAIEPIKRGIWKTLNYESSTIHCLDSLRESPEVMDKISLDNRKVLDMPNYISEMVSEKLEENGEKLVVKVKLELNEITES